MDISKLTEHSYIPYSKNNQIAVVRSRSGDFFPGCRIENISYPLSISAAQNALFTCLSEGYTPKQLWLPQDEDTMVCFWEKEFNVEIINQPECPWDNVSFRDVELDTDIPVIDTLKTLLNKAVVGESNFPVAALLETDRGFFSGVNIECSSWVMGLCAERVVMGKAIAYGATELKKLHIHTRYGEFSSPCGACRQVIIEHMPNQQVHLHHADETESIHFGQDFLPHSFRSSKLTN